MTGSREVWMSTLQDGCQAQRLLHKVISTLPLVREIRTQRMRNMLGLAPNHEMRKTCPSISRIWTSFRKRRD